MLLIYFINIKFTDTKYKNGKVLSSERQTWFYKINFYTANICRFITIDVILVETYSRVHENMFVS